MDESKLLCLTITAHRKKEMSYEEFVKYLNGYHGAICADVMAEHGIIEYTQVSKLLGESYCHVSRANLFTDL